MTKTIGATEVVRNFSEILNTIKYHGSHYVIMKGGKPVAHIGPLEPSYSGPTLGDLPSLVKKLPRLGDEGKRFEADLRAIRRHQPRLPSKGAWA